MYKDIGARRIMRIVKALRGRSFTGLSNGELATAIDDSPVNVTRACQAMIDEGFVEKLSNGRFALSTAFLQVAVAHQREMSGVIDRVGEINQRVNAGSIN